MKTKIDSRSQMTNLFFGAVIVNRLKDIRD